MTKGFWGALALLAAAVLCTGAAEAKQDGDRKYATDWRTGVEVAPGAYTWTNDNFDQKKQIISDTAASQQRTCSHYAFLQWPAEAGTIDALKAETKSRYQAAGYVIDEKPGANPGETVWLAAHPERHAIVQWGMTSGTTVYLSCITAGAPAANADKPLIVAFLLALGLGALGGGLWLYLRTRAKGKASLTWPTAAGTVKTAEVRKYRTKGGPQFMAHATYKYSVNGRAYTGDRIRFGQYAGAQAAADADVAKYAPNTSVQVRYDPRDPSVSTLEPGTAGHNVWGLVLAITGAIIAGLSVMLLFIE